MNKIDDMVDTNVYTLKQVKRFFYLYLLLSLIIFTFFINKSDVLYSQTLKNSRMFFDANSTSFSRDGKLQIFEGDVVVVAGGIILTSDRIELDQRTREIRAKGHIMFLTEDQVLVGDSVTYNIKTMEFVCVNCSMRIGDIDTAKDISISILGFSSKEIEFEKQRGLRLAEIQAKKKKLKSEYEQRPDPNLISKYVLLLEQESLISKQESSSLSQMSPEKRERYKLRRKYWEEIIAENKHKVTTSFFMVEGKTIKKVDRLSYSMDRPFWTPCKCENDESAPWGIAASSIDAEIGEYADVYNCVLQIKGIPVLYFPYLKIPLKTKRQSGLLFPNITSKSSSGLIYSQPFFINIADDMDSTITAEYLSKRGPKLGIEYRYQYKQYSGIFLQVEGLKDQEWIEAKQRRKDSLWYYESQNIDNLESVKSRLYSPDSDYRWSVSSRGMYYFTPRLSLLGNLNVYSDHRYKEDLRISGDIQSAFEDDEQTSFFNVSKVKLNYDGSNLYFGLGSDMADGILTNRSYSGQQIPFYLKYRSKLYGLDLKVLPHNSYVYLGFDHYSIIDIVDHNLVSSNQNTTFEGKGNWDGLYVSMVTPLSIKGVAKIDHFIRGDLRRISYDGLADEYSTVHSFNTGFNLSIPLSGEMVLYKDSDDTQKIFKHNMDLIFTYDIRPTPEWNGEYGKITDNKDAMYFATDKSKEVASNEISSSYLMKKYHKIGFKTINSWHIYQKEWKLQLKDPEFHKKKYDSYYEQATDELASGLSTSNYTDVYDEDLKWRINRYRLLDSDNYNLLNLETNISYDFVLQSERKAQIKELEAKGETKDETKLAKPWGELYILGNTNISNFRFYLDMYYNFYYEDFSSQIFSMYLPRFLRTNVSFSYQIGSEFNYNEVNQNFETTKTYTGTVSVGSTILPHLDFLGYYAKRTSKGGNVEDDYETKFGLVYKPKTDCWSLSFLRWKKIGVLNKDAEYILRLSVYILSNQRDLPFNFLGSL